MAQTIGSLDLNAFSDLYSDSTQYFWFEGNASATYGAGAHVTLVPDTSFISNPTGQNILMNTDGLSIRNGLLPMMTLDNDSLDFNVVDTTAGTYTTTATFTSTGAQIGQTSGAHIQISSSGFDVKLNSSTNIATFGSSAIVLGGATTYDSRAEITPTDFRIIQPQVGRLDHAVFKAGVDDNGLQRYVLGVENYASSLYSTNNIYYVGDTCTYDGQKYVCNTAIRTPEEFTPSHWSALTGVNSVVLGSQNVASGAYAMASGYDTRAIGSRSHAQNLGTIARGQNQTVIGKYNVADMNNDYAFIIGNGVYRSPSNALTVDWNGKIQTPQMQAGNIAATSVSANSYTNVSVTFSPAMSGTPIVVCGVVSTSTAGAIGSITSAVTSTSTTGFTCRIFNAGSTTRTPSVNWIALNI